MTALKADRVMPALERVRAELLRRARGDAERVIADAQREADRIIAEASDTARTVAEKACAAGEAAGTRAAAAEMASLRRALRQEVLSAQDDAYRRWRQHAVEAVLRLREEPNFATWQGALRKTARVALGDDARVVEDPDGGVVAELGRRRLDLSLPAIAERALDQIAPQADGLWS